MKTRLCIALFPLVVPFVSPAADRVVDPVDLNRTVPIFGQRHSRAIPQNDVGPADPSTELRYITLLLEPAPGLDSLLASQQDPTSPEYHRWLTPEQFGDRFGLSPADIGKVVEWLQGEGLRVHDVARGRHWITFSGSVANLGRALHTEFHRYSVAGATHIANAGDPAVPAALANVIAGFHGLTDFRARPMHVAAAPWDNIGTTHYLAPADFATIYDVKPLYNAGIDGTGVSIAVVGQSDIVLSDMQAFRSTFGLPAKAPKVVLYGPDPGSNADVQVEADLDLQWSGAVARNADIIYVNSQDVLDSAEYAIDQNLASIITFSYGYCEQDAIAYRSIAQQGNAQGITWMASSGDAGAATCDGLYSTTPQTSLGPTLSFPADLPEITAVGGTELSSASQYWAANNDPTTLASALSYTPEQVWNESAMRSAPVASGGGFSQFLAKPWWQIGSRSDGARDVPDVALAAGTLVPFAIVVNGKVTGVGGTSASSPSFAGIVALLNQSLVQQKALSQPGLGNINPVLYRLAQSTTGVFHDITAGDNTVPCVQGSPQCIDGMMGYAAGPGYDLATGLGTVDANNLVTEWSSGTASQTVLTASPTVADPGTPVTLTATVRGGGGAAPTGTVLFASYDITVGTATLAPAGGGGSTASITVPAGLLVLAPVYAQYSGDAVYGGSSGSATVGLNTASGHSVVVPSIGPNPVPQAENGSWPYQLILSERAGVFTRLTGFTIDGVDNSGNITMLNRGIIPANGTVTEELTGHLTSFPTNRTFVFSGQDADGTTWSQQLTVTFAGPPGPYLTPSISLVSSPAIMQQNVQADPSCQWEQQLTLTEKSGFLTELSAFTLGPLTYTSQIQSLFGTTRIAPWGRLNATICWSTANTSAPSTKTLTITGTATNGVTTSAAVTVQLQAPADTPATFGVSPAALDLAVPDTSHNAGATAGLSFSGGSPAWQVSVVPSAATTGWLKVTPISGTGSGQLTVAANTAALSPGVYQASIAIAAPGAVPDHILIPVILAIGASGTQITAVVNAASYQSVAAPGMLATVYGLGISQSNLSARTIPLPLGLGGVSATVNGVSAPIVGTFPQNDQINIQIPYEAGAGPSVLAVNTNGQVAYYPLTIAPAAPGLFGIWSAAGLPLTGVQQGQTVVAYVTGDGDVSPFLATGATPSSTSDVSDLPRPRLALSVSVGGMDVGTPAFIGITSGSVGTTQINFTVPATAPTGAQPIVVTVGGVPSNAVTVNVTPAQ